MSEKTSKQDLRVLSLELAVALQQAVALLKDYVRVYPNNSGRTIRFLDDLEMRLGSRLELLAEKAEPPER